MHLDTDIFDIAACSNLTTYYFINSQFKLAVDPNLRCFVSHGTNQQKTCQEFIRTNSNCAIDVTFETEISNIGGACLLIKKVKAIQNGNKYFTDISSWDETERNFCPQDDLIVTYDISGFDLCFVEKTDIFVEISLNQGGVDQTGITSATFLARPPAPAPAPAPAPSPL